MRATPEASSVQVPEAGSGQALQVRGLMVKNEVGALATSIIYQLKDFSIAKFGFINPDQNVFGRQFRGIKQSDKRMSVHIL
jgi:hypothetical protein